jgi:DNA polymerase III delta prime subunit
MSIQNTLWVEKYRPRTIDDCVLPDSIRATFIDIVKSNKMQNLLLCGGPGCGKTTVARALCEQMGIDYIFLNASENGNIDTLRTTVRNFASAVSLSGKGKVVILDEADYLNPQSTQPALRGFIEEFSSNCRFIFTCNFKNRIIEPLHSRCSIVEFAIPNKQKPSMAAAMLQRLSVMLDAEKVAYDRKILAEVVMRFFPDFRRTINELQRYSASGKIDAGILANIKDAEFDELFASMKSKNFTDVRKWVAANSDADYSQIFRKIYDDLVNRIDKSSIPSVVLILAEYQYRMSFSADHEICMAACMAEIMMNAQFK